MKPSAHAAVVRALLALFAFVSSVLLILFAANRALAGGGAVGDAGHKALVAVQVPYATASPAPSTSAFTTLVSATPAQTTLIELADTGGYTFWLSWAPTCAGLSTTGQNVTLVAGGSSGDYPIYIPPGSCVGARWVASAPSAGELDTTFLY
jgi:hypothetical protein